MKKFMVFVVSVILTLTSFGQIVPNNAGAISGNISVCANGTAVYAVSPITNATSYMWVIPAGASITNGFGTNTIIIQFGTVGGTIMVFGQNGNQFGNGSEMQVSVTSSPSITVTATPNDICAGTSTSLNVTGNGTSWSWTGGATTPSITVTPSSTTTYTVAVTGGNGCIATGSVTVTVHTTALNVSLNLTQDNMCTDVNSVLLSGGLPTGGTYSCTNPNIVFDGTTIYPPITGPGTWPITYTVTDMYGCAGHATDMFTTNPVPVVMFNNITGSLTTGSAPVNLNNFVMPVGGTFTGPGTTVGSTMFDFAKAGVGTHMLTYTYEHPITGCGASQIQYVTIAQGDSTGNGSDGIDDVKGVIDNINIFPNPVIDQLHITYIAQEITSLVIVDMLGQVVYTTAINAEKTIAVGDFHAGTYFIRFTSIDGFSSTRKFVKL